jgi:DNA-binding transcriptional LysR family regulator
MELEVRHLRVVATIAETGSLTKAAAALRLSQPGLSAQLRRIEQLLGGRLFDRGSHGVVPTALGELVITRASAVLPTLDELLDLAALAGRSDAQPSRLRLGSVTAPLLGGLISAVRARFPGAEITAREQYSPLPLVEDVAVGRLEAAVVGDSPGYELAPRAGVVLHTVATEPVFALLPAGHALAAQDEVDLADLAAEPWAVPRPDGDRTREYWATALSLAGHRIRVPYQAEGRLLIEIVRSGHAVSLCQATFEELPGIAVRPLAGDPLWYRQILAWHENGPLAEASEFIRRHVAEEYEHTCSRATPFARWRARCQQH